MFRAKKFLKVAATFTALVMAVTLVAACSGGGSSASGPLVIYSGRSEALIGDLLKTFTQETGIEVEVRYGDSGELAAQLLTEGSASPADVFFSQDAGALGALSQKNRFEVLPDNILSLVPERFRAANGEWVGVSGRVRVIAYDTKKVTNPPTTIDELLDPKWKGKIGFAPTNASWQSFVTALRVERGEQGAEQWLREFAANNPRPYEKNSAVLDGIANGQIELGLVNHYYLYERKNAKGNETVAIANSYAKSGDVGGLVNVAGVGILDSTKKTEKAQQFVEFLLSPTAQNYFATKTFEFPLVSGIALGNPDLPNLTTLVGPNVDLSDLSSLAETQALLQKVGLLTK